MSREATHFEVIIVGGGIAGASLAYFLAERGVGDVVVLEREPQPGYHATGRSAAVLAELDPVLPLLELKVESAGFLRNPPAGFSDHPLLAPSGILVTFRGEAGEPLRGLADVLRQRGTVVEVLSPSEVIDRIPVLSPEHLDGGVLLPEDGHIDVHALLWGYLGHAKRRGAQVRCGVEVLGIRVQGGRCRGVQTSAGELHARWVVDAAGAWARAIGVLAGATDIPLTPHRRTIITFAAPIGLDVRGWPLVNDVSHQLYFAPESGGLLASPMDEEPMVPCDARPDDLVVAETVLRLGRLAPRLVPGTLRRTWAGLRTFTPDRVLVVGEDPRVEGFFWLAGQGGCGIETSPSVGRIAADLLLDGRSACATSTTLAPVRFTTA